MLKHTTKWKYIWKSIHAGFRLVSIPFHILEIIIHICTLGYSSMSPTQWWAEKSLRYCVRIRKFVLRIPIYD